MKTPVIVVILEGGRYNGQPYQAQELFHTLVIETYIERHFYEAAGRNDDQGRAVFVFKKVEDRP